MYFYLTDAAGEIYGIINEDGVLEGVMVATATGAGFVMGNALSAGAALAIGTGIAFGTGFVDGMVAEASTQVINDGGVTGAVGMTIDILRNRKNQKQKVSVNNQLYAYCF